jgi:gliding motility-associated-like protein
VFTPNGDGVNDLYFLQRSSNISKINASIYDRWGNKVYEVTSESGQVEWDGNTMTGKQAPSGTYFYIITAQGKDGKTYDEKGSLSLIR